MIFNAPDKNANSTSWHVGITPVFPSSLLLSDNAAIESLLSDIPFLAIGLLAFAVLTFLLIVRKFDVRSTPLFISPLLAFIAVVLDIDQLLVQNLPGAVDSSTLSSILPLLIAREVLLGISIGMRFLYFWVYLCSRTTWFGANPGDRQNPSLKRINSEFEEPNFLKLQNSPSPELLWPSSRNPTSGHSSRFIVAFPSALIAVPKYATLLATASIPILQLIWRLFKKFNRHGVVYVANSTIEVLVSVVVIVDLLALVLVEIADTAGYLSLNWRKAGKRETLKSYTPVLLSACLELGLSIGNLLCFEFSETSLGRLLQALELYILILYILVSTFYEKGQANRFSAKTSDVAEENKDQIANLGENTPPTGRTFSTQIDTPGELLPTSMSFAPQRNSRYVSAGSWLSSVRTNRDNETDNNTGVLSMSGSSIFSESKGGISSWISGKKRNTRSLKSLSGFLGGVGGRIRSVSWDMLNDPMEEGALQNGGSKTADVKDSIPSASRKKPSSSGQPGFGDNLQSQIPSAKKRAPPLIGQTERHAFQSDLSFPFSGGKGETVSNAVPTSSADDTGRSSTAPTFETRNNGFRLTPILPAASAPALDLHRSSSNYDPEEGPSYSPRLSSSYTKSIRSSLSHSIAEIELFLRQQRAGLAKSVAELKNLQEDRTDQLDVSNGAQRESLTSDFSFSKFPEPPRNYGQLRNSGGSEGVRSSSDFRRVSMGDFSRYRTPLSFPSPVLRTSGDSSVLGMNEAAMTLGLGLGGDSDSLNLRQLDVTSFIAAGGETTDPFVPRSRLAGISVIPPSFTSGTEDGDGVDTPPPSAIRFATKVHVPPFISVSANVSQLSPGSTSSTEIGHELNNASPDRSTELTPGLTRILSNRPRRKRFGIGLPSSVKLSTSNPIPLPPTAVSSSNTLSSSI